MKNQNYAILLDNLTLSVMCLRPTEVCALQNVFKAKSATNTPESQMACGGNCASCSGSACAENHAKIEANKETK